MTNVLRTYKNHRETSTIKVSYPKPGQQCNLLSQLDSHMRLNGYLPLRAWATREGLSFNAAKNRIKRSYPKIETKAVSRHVYVLSTEKAR